VLTATTRTIRPAAPADRDALAALYRRCRRLAEWLPAAERAKADFDRDTKGEEIFVAIGEEGTLDGFIAVCGPECFVHHLYVRPEARRQGVANALLESLEGRFTFPWRLKCVRVNVAALEFYGNRGWKEIAAGMGVQGEYAMLELRR
jgi:ribosomal protein S18 acetylase RimI-like enzyme